MMKSETKITLQNGTEVPAIEEVPMMQRHFKQWDCYYHDFIVGSGVGHPNQKLMGQFDPTAGVSEPAEQFVLRTVNEEGNRFPYRPDAPHHDEWSHELTDEGDDCENFVLWKRRKLIVDYSWNPALLRPIICQQLGGLRRGHMVLGVQFKHGVHDNMAILDSLTNRIHAWTTVQYRMLYILGHGRTWNLLVDRVN